MLSLLLPKTIFGINIGVLLLSVALMLVAVALLAWLTRWPEEKKGTIKYDLVKDSALAFLTAVLVTAIYSSLLEFRRVSDLFSLVIGSEVRPEVLDATKTEIFKREIIRDNANLRFTVLKDPALSAGLALLRLEAGYDVHSLKPEGDRDYTFVQELDNVWLKGKDKDGQELPRFDVVSVGDRVYRGNDLKGMVEQGLFKDKQPTPLKPWPPREVYADQRTGVRISSTRTEIIHVPGTYNIVLGELTKAIRVYVETPDDIQHKFKSWFQRKGHDFRPEGNDQYFEGIVLPGQSISIQFWNRSDRPPAASPTRTRVKGQ